MFCVVHSGVYLNCLGVGACGYDGRAEYEWFHEAHGLKEIGSNV